MAGKHETEETRSRTRPGLDSIEGRTQPTTRIASKTKPIEIITVPTNARAGEKLMPAATRGVPDMIPIGQSLKTRLTPANWLSLRPASPASIGAAYAAKWK